MGHRGVIIGQSPSVIVMLDKVGDQHRCPKTLEFEANMTGRRLPFDVATGWRAVKCLLQTLSLVLWLGGTAAQAATVESVSAGTGLDPTHALSVEREYLWDGDGLKADRADRGSAPADAEAPTLHLPAPAALWLFGSGLGVLGLAQRRIRATWRRRGEVRPGRKSILQRALKARVARSAAARACIAATMQRNDTSAKGTGGGGDGRGGELRSKLAALRQGSDVEKRFAELAEALLEQPDVALGRAFGYHSLKFGKRDFLVCDESGGGIAFRVGEANADRMSREMLVVLWNPNDERQPKRSWLFNRGGNSETLVLLALNAYESALQETARRGPEQAALQSIRSAETV